MSKLSPSQSNKTVRQKDTLRRAMESWTEHNPFLRKNFRVIFLSGAVGVFVLATMFASSMNIDLASIIGIQATQFAMNAISIGVGFLTGFAPLWLIYLARRNLLVVVALLGLFALFVILIPGLGLAFTGISGAGAFVAGLVIAWRMYFKAIADRDTTFGSSRWATYDDLKRNNLLSDSGFWLGSIIASSRDTGLDTPTEKTLRYSGERHMLTVAPTRAGKGVSSVIPNLLTHPGSLIVIDPKGENARETGYARAKMGQSVYLVDPWRITAPQFNISPATLNPLDWLKAGDPDLIENAMVVADSLVVKNPEAKEPFWDEEAKFLLTGLILHVVTHGATQGDRRNLGTVRDFLMLSPKQLKGDNDGDETTAAVGLFQTMAESPNPVVSGVGSSFLLKDEKLLGNIFASAQSHTHFLDSPAIRKSLSASSFKFEDMKKNAISVYLILPADRLETFGRWLRLLIQQAIIVNARNIHDKPNKPILFMLDEMAALGKLPALEQAYSLMAGFGMQVWGIIQDLSQLERIYGKGWQTFIANSGVIQYFGSRDQMTAEYFSKLCGKKTVTTMTSGISRAISTATGAAGGAQHTSGTTTSTSYGHAVRDLILPDELMTFDRNKQILFVENMHPIAATRTVWYENSDLKSLAILPKTTAAA